MSSRRAKLIGLAWVVLAGVVAAGFASSFSVLAHLVPFRDEQKLAQTFNPARPDTLCKNSAGEHALKKLVARLYPLPGDDPAIQVHVSVVQSPQVNAYAVLGGQIYVNQALLKQAESPDELAGVLAHEMAHVVHRDVLEGVMMQVGTWGALELILGTPSSGADIATIMMNLQYTRSQERAADRGGLKRLVKAQVNVKGFEDFFDRMRKKGGGGPALFSDHPSDTSREAMARQYEGQKSRPVLSNKEWRALKEICRKPASASGG